MNHVYFYCPKCGYRDTIISTFLIYEITPDGFIEVKCKECNTIWEIKFVYKEVNSENN